MPVGVLIDKDVVEAAGVLRNADACYLFHLVSIGQTRHVKHYSTQVSVGALAKLERLDDVVSGPAT